MSTFANNDDDLFDYDPSSETNQTTSENNISEKLEEISGLSKDQEKLLKQVKDNITVSDADIIGDTDGKVGTLRSELYTSFQTAISILVDNIRTEHFSRSIHVTLDELTQGRFSMLNLFYKYELKIARKISLIALFDKVLISKDDEEKSPFIETISELLKIEISPLYIKSSFSTTNRMLIHSLTIDKVIYQFLAEKLKMSPNQNILDYNFEHSTIDEIEKKLNSYTIENFNKTIEHNMLNAFFSTEKTETNTTLQSMLEEQYSTKVEYAHGMRTLQDE